MIPTWPAKSESKGGAKKAHSPRPPSGGRMFKQLNDETEADSSVGFHMGDAAADRHNPLHGPGFSLKF